MSAVTTCRFCSVPVLGDAACADCRALRFDDACVCSECDGEGILASEQDGEMIAYACRACGGTGQVG